MTFELDEAIDLLTRTPVVLRAMLDELPERCLEGAAEEGAWSVRDVACHMADLERDGWIPRVRTILDHGPDFPLPGIERERFREHFSGTALDDVLGEFERSRATNLQALRDLGIDETALARRGLHGAFGVVTLSQLLSAWVVHDLTHIAQLTRTLAAQYRVAVGPWQQYLSVLRRG